MAQNILEQYTIVHAINGGYLLEHKKTKERAIYKNIISHIHYEDQKALIERRTQIDDCPQLQKIIHCSISQHKFVSVEQFLSNISLIYEEIALRFDAEIDSRIKQKLYWTEEEILNTLESAIQALRVLHEHHLVHGDIRPSSIACDLTGEVKLLDQFATSNHFFKNIQQIVQSGGYLSPEQCKNVLQDNQEYVLESRNDVFSLGLVFLEATTLISSLDIVKNLRINEEILKMRLLLVGKLGYSQRLVNILSNMLQINGENRPSIQFIQQLGWGHSETSKSSQQLQDNSILPFSEADSVSHSIILKKVQGEQNSLFHDQSNNIEIQNQQRFSEIGVKNNNFTNHSINTLFEDQQKFKKVLDSSQDQSMSMQSNIKQMTAYSDNQRSEQNSQTRCQEINPQLKQNNCQSTKNKPNQRCRTECEEIKLYTKASQKSFSKICEDTDDFDHQRECEGQQRMRKNNKSSSISSQKGQSSYQEQSTNEQFDNCCPKCVKKLVSPLIRNAFSPRLDVIQDEESIRKSLIKQTPIIRMSKQQRELESLEPYNFNNFQIPRTTTYALPPTHPIQQMGNYQTAKHQRIIRPPSQTDSQNNFYQTQQFSSQNLNSFHQSSIQSTWNQSNSHFNSVNQQINGDQFVKQSYYNPLKNMQNNQFLNKSSSYSKSSSYIQTYQQALQQLKNNDQQQGNQKKLPFNSSNNTSISSFSNQSAQRKPLFNNTQNKLQNNQENQNQYIPKIKQV